MNKFNVATFKSNLRFLKFCEFDYDCFNHYLLNKAPTVLTQFTQIHALSTEKILTYYGELS